MQPMDKSNEPTADRPADNPLLRPPNFSESIETSQAPTVRSQSHDQSLDQTTDPTPGQGLDLIARMICAGTQRAQYRPIGGAANLIRELSRISAELDKSIAFEWMTKRLQFYCYELESFMAYGMAHGMECRLESVSARSRLETLNTFLFANKKFRCLPGRNKKADRSAQEADQEFGSGPVPASDANSSFILSRALVTRTAPPILLALFYMLLAEHIGVVLEFVDLKPTTFLRWMDGGCARYIDVTRAGAILSDDELIETLHSRFQIETLPVGGVLENYTFDALIVDYLKELKRSLCGETEVSKLLFLQNTLIAYQPNQIHLLAERAELHCRLGKFKSALTDLKRYFSFFDRKRAPLEVTRLHDELILAFDR